MNSNVSSRLKRCNTYLEITRNDDSLIVNQALYFAAGRA